MTREFSPPATSEGERRVVEADVSSPTKDVGNDEVSTIPTLASTLMVSRQDPSDHGQRIWQLAQKCQGLCLSGRILRRLPVLGLAMYTWVGEVGMHEALGALEKAVDEEVVAMKTVS